MGCDIHIYTERKIDGKWKCIDYWELDNWEEEIKYDHVKVYNGRNYELFGALAGVREGNIEHILPKGFPEDASDVCAIDFTEWDTDAHTPSWLTLEELKIQKEKLGDKIKRSGMISKTQYEELKNGKAPTMWCRWTTRTDYVQAEWEDDGNPLKVMVESIEKFLKRKYYKYELEQIHDSDIRIVFWFDN